MKEFFLGKYLDIRPLRISTYYNKINITRKLIDRCGKLPLMKASNKKYRIKSKQTWIWDYQLYKLLKHKYI